MYGYIMYGRKQRDLGARKKRLMLELDTSPSRERRSAIEHELGQIVAEAERLKKGLPKVA